MNSIESSPSLEYEHRRAARGRDMPIQVSRWKRRLLIAGLVFLLLVLLAAGSYVYYAVTYVMTLHARVCCELVKLGSTTDARLVKLYVKPGDKVTRGQPLARLDDRDLAAALDAAKAQLAVAEAALAYAKAERDQFRARLPDRIRQARAARDQAKARYERLKKGARPEELDALKARLATAKKRQQFYELEVKIAQELARSGVGSSLEMEQKRTALAAAQNAYIEAQMDLKLALAGATKEELEAARSALEEKEAALALAEAGQGELKRLEAQVAMREADVARARANVAQREANLKTKCIVSPVDGAVLRTFGEEGEVCRKGEPIVLVRDDSKGFWIEGFVHEEDADRVNVGQPASVEVVVGSWRFVPARVELISFATSSAELRALAGPGGSAAPGPARGEMVWLKLRFDQPPRMRLLPGMTARAFIKVR